jgi:hypothetical protein
VVPDVSDERIASIFRVVEYSSKAASKQVAQCTTRRHIPEEDTLLNWKMFLFIPSYVYKGSVLSVRPREICYAFESKETVTGVLLHTYKAFDRASHEGLVGNSFFLTFQTTQFIF